MMNHDSLYHRLFSHPIMVEGLVRDFIPEAMAAGVVFEDMERRPAKAFARKRGDRRDGDIIWRMQLRTGQTLYLYLLFEFQSTVDWWMSLRNGVYTCLFLQDLIMEQGLKSGDPLPPVLPIVVYNGERPWSAPCGTDGLFAVPDTSPLHLWQPLCRSYLLDMSAFEPADLKRRQTLASLLFRLERRHKDPMDLTILVHEVIRWFREHPGYAELKLVFAELVGNALRKVEVPGPIPDDLQEVNIMLETSFIEWRKEWMEKGLAEGRAKGEIEGRIEGQKQILLLQLDRRFGSVPNAIIERIANADSPHLEAWSIRLMDAQTLDDIFETGWTL